MELFTGNGCGHVAFWNPSFHNLRSSTAKAKRSFIANGCTCVQNIHTMHIWIYLKKIMCDNGCTKQQDAKQCTLFGAFSTCSQLQLELLQSENLFINLERVK